MQRQTFTAGTVIFREGDDSREAYRVLTGNVEISLNAPEGKLVLSVLGQDEIFGEMGLVSDKPRSATATAVTAVELETIDGEGFNRLILHEPAQLQPYLATFFERMRNADNQLRMQLRRQLDGAGKSTQIAWAACEANSLVSEEQVTEVKKPAPAEPYRLRLTSVGIPISVAADPVDVEIRKFPFKIGRRDYTSPSSVFVTNDLFLHDQPPFTISQNHCAIVWVNNRYFVTDRGSRLGTIVNGTALGLGSQSLTCPVRTGENDIVLGTRNSPHRFKLVVSAGAAG